MSAEGHFYASNAAEWRSGDDLSELVEYFKNQGLTFSLWFVPGSRRSYPVEDHAPQVPGAYKMCSWGACAASRHSLAPRGA